MVSPCARRKFASFDAITNTSVYPNPTNNHRITIESEVAIADIQLVTISGQLLISIKHPVFQNNAFTLENLPQGFYFMTLSTDSQSVTKKIIVN